MVEYRKRIKSSVSLIFSVFFLFCVATAVTAQTPQQIAQKAFRSTVLLVMEDTNGQPLSLGSGFFVGVGVSVLTIRDGQNLNFAIPSNYLKTLLTKIGYAKPLTQAKPANGQRSLLIGFGVRNMEGVTGGKLSWRRATKHDVARWIFSFSLRNHLREDVKNVHYYVIFYDELDDPIDVLDTWFTTQIPAGLAKRVKSWDENPYIKREITYGFVPLSPFYYYLNIDDDVYELTKRVEFRILDYEIVR